MKWKKESDINVTEAHDTDIVGLYTDAGLYI